MTQAEIRKLIRQLQAADEVEMGIIHALVDAVREDDDRARIRINIARGAMMAMLDACGLPEWLQEDDAEEQVTHMSLAAYDTHLGGEEARSVEEVIRAAADNGCSLNKYADPTEGPRTGLSVEEASAIAHEDHSLIWVQLQEGQD